MIDFRDIEVKAGNQSFIITVALGLISLLLLLISFSFEVTQPHQQQPIEIAMNFGNTTMGQGEEEPAPAESLMIEASQEAIKQNTAVSEPTATTQQAITQKTTETRPVASTKKSNRTPSKADNANKPSNKPEGDQKANNALNSILSGKGKSSNGQGNSSTTGNVGDPKGNDSNGTGVGENWKSTIPEPQQHNCSTSGTIMVEIIVNASGSIKSATPGVKGSTSTDACLKTRAKELVLKYVTAYPGSDGRKGIYRVNLR